MDTLAERVRSERERRKMSQDELAKAAGISQSTIAQIERGRNKGTKYILSLAKALSVAPEWLGTGKGHRFQLDLAKLSDLPADDDPDPFFVSPVIETSAQKLIGLVRIAEEKRVPSYLFDSLSAAVKVWLDRSDVADDGRGD